jgi:hypothetical protein
MIKDRDQKQKALKLAIANRWFPQLEVDVHPGEALEVNAPLVTDLDVFACIPDEFKGFRFVVFDCKTKARESAVNRALWLAGVLTRVGADQGFCILKKDALILDHVLMANRLKVILLAEDEFDLYARSTSTRYGTNSGFVGELAIWDEFYDLGKRFPKLDLGLRFIRSGFWMIEDSTEACRKTLACLRSLQTELDPSKPEHISVFLDFCALFSHALAVVVCQIFKTYLQPSKQEKLSEALLVMLYGGREAYQHRNELYRRAMAKDAEQPVPDLALPEWERFLQLCRQILDAPMEMQRVPLILREVAFSFFRKDTDRSFAKLLCAESAQAARFAVLVPTYLAKAAKLPPEFIASADNALLPLLTSK